MNIRNTRVTDTTLFPQDDIPLGKLLTDRYLQPLVRSFEFRNFEIAKRSADQVLVKLGHGLYSEGDEDYPVSRLEIGDRKIVFALEGTSTEASGFFTELTDLLGDISGCNRPLDHTLRAVESEIVAKMDFSVEDLYAPGYFAFVKEMVTSEVSLDFARADVRPALLRFRVDYLLQDKSIQERGINLSPKEFVLEPRQNTPLEDGIFYSKAPVDTSAHVQLLEQLEVRLA